MEKKSDEPDNPERRLHSLPNHFSCVPFFRRRRPIPLTQFVTRNRGGADERPVALDAALYEESMYRQGGPLDRVFDVALFLARLLFHLLIERYAMD